ncbi:MAG: copper resistance protein NlpE N-terminal domain-containing protein [Flavobacteriales bacterium]|nr:copper resistance protein NlpE N-terminal domain-containing protein [Flavobacteriales bacterium]MBK7941706.1 copper resistance protein NlpE N-terminal domain-containing protein [Flavobacteriales bacterium]MBK8949268.1 copper resistance protein NlpE N-terminal domain-containing protein [Flavobacteriales bacterium]MBK9700248.1 copper resistance protein NlpE N-terminal domain-containing protein [Flavobacteriales bacterium]
MRASLLLLPALVIASCGGGSVNDGSVAHDSLPAVGPTRALPATPIDWPGYYEDTLPCAGCHGIVTQLWVRSDSTFILRRRYLDRGEAALGLIGRWHVVAPDAPGAQPLLTIGQAGDKPDFHQRTEAGLRMVDEMGAPFASQHPYTLEKLSDELEGEIPRMRLTGTFTFLADAMRFAPCGAGRSWPCAGGEDLGAEEGELVGSMNGADLERRYRRSVTQGGEPWTIEVECSLDLGPAMEGDGSDEYVLIHQVLTEGMPCP